MSWNGTNWTNNGGTNFQPGGTHTQSRGSFLSTSTLSFSENVVIIGSTEAANPLPITLAHFKGEIEPSGAYLYWQTVSELNNDRFEVKRSSDGKEFKQIGIVDGQGTTKVVHNYGLLDETPNTGKNYYRLKQVDFDGTASYSPLIVLNWSAKPFMKLIVYPNPTQQHNLNFKVQKLSLETMLIKVIDLTGRILYHGRAGFRGNDRIWFDSCRFAETRCIPG
jgi:hypothetical protein